MAWVVGSASYQSSGWDGQDSAPANHCSTRYVPDRALVAAQRAVVLQPSVASPGTNTTGLPSMCSQLSAASSDPSEARSASICAVEGSPVCSGP